MNIIYSVLGIMYIYIFGAVKVKEVYSQVSVTPERKVSEKMFPKKKYTSSESYYYLHKTVLSFHFSIL